MNVDELLTAQEVADWLQVKVGLLATWRSKGRGVGLPWVLVGNHVRYRRTDVEAFLDANTKAGARPAIVPARRRAG